MSWLLLEKYWKPALALLLVVLWSGYMHHLGAASVQAKFDKHLLADAKAREAAERNARETEHAQAQEVQRLLDENTKQKSQNEATQKRLVDDLLAARRKLRERWSGCVPTAPGSAQEPDGAARDRAESAGRIVRAADDADAQIRALQEFLKAERK